MTIQVDGQTSIMIAVITDDRGRDRVRSYLHRGMDIRCLDLHPQTARLLAARLLTAADEAEGSP